MTMGLGKQTKMPSLDITQNICHNEGPTWPWLTDALATIGWLQKLGQPEKAASLMPHSGT